MQDALTESVREKYGNCASITSPGVDGAASGGTVAPGEADPPLLIGGLQPEDVGQLAHIGVDFLTVTVPELTAGDMMAESEHAEDGYGRTGFAKSEQRTVRGGTCWRRWEPHQASERWGKSYESWEFSGPSAWWPSQFLRARECKPSRIDIAWDFSVDEGYTADRFHDAVEPWCKGKKITTGIAGHDGVNTRYLGSRTSDRWVRVYRKDLQDAVIAEILGPTLRVELVLKGDHAAAFWEVWKKAGTDDAAWPSAAAVLEHMTGLAISPGEMPSLEVPECKDEAQRLLAFVEQHGPTLSAYRRAGVPIDDLVDEHMRDVGKHTRSRQGKRVRELVRLGVQQVTQLARDVMRGKQLARKGA